MITITLPTGGKHHFGTGLTPDAVYFTHTSKRIKSVPATHRSELTDFLGQLDTVDAVFSTITRIDDLDNPDDL